MASIANEYAAFAHEPPIIEINAGIVIVHYRCGGIERAMSVRTFARAVDRAARALTRHAAGDEHILIDD